MCTLRHFISTSYSSDTTLLFLCLVQALVKVEDDAILYQEPHETHTEETEAKKDKQQSEVEKENVKVYNVDTR